MGNIVGLILELQDGEELTFRRGADDSLYVQARGNVDGGRRCVQVGVPQVQVEQFTLGPGAMLAMKARECLKQLRAAFLKVGDDGEGK